MKTYQPEIKELNKEVKALERKELQIGKGYKFKRVHGKKDCVKVIGYDNDHVEIQDSDGTHFVPRCKFTTENFKR